MCSCFPCHATSSITPPCPLNTLFASNDRDCLFVLVALFEVFDGPSTPADSKSHMQICASSDPDNKVYFLNGDQDKPYPSLLCPVKRKSGEHALSAGGFDGCFE